LKGFLAGGPDGFLARGLAACAVALALAAAPAVGMDVDASRYADRSKADCGFQKAIDEAAAAGGGVVTLPAGTFVLRRGFVLRSGVSIVGAGMDKTVLTPLKRAVRLELAKDGPDEGGRYFLKDLPDTLDVGSAVMVCRSFPVGWMGYPKSAWVTAVDRNDHSVTLSGPYGLDTLKAGQGILIWGDSAGLDRAIKKGDTEIVLKNANIFKPGDELAIGEPQNESLPWHAFVKEVRGNSLVLDEPLKVEYKAWPPRMEIGNMPAYALIWALYPVFHGANVKNVRLADLTVKGPGLEPVYSVHTRYTISGIHIYNAENLKIERVAVRDWAADGISLQQGKNILVSKCEVTGVLGNGLHPGTALREAVFEDCLSARNGAGFFFCINTDKLLLRRNRFLDNRGGGITGFGSGNDRNSTIEDNVISGNGGPGIIMDGGGKCGNVVRNNVIENNSSEKAGKWPGILIQANTVSAAIEGNTIRDTQDNPTQFVGIEEKPGTQKDRDGNIQTPDGNVIRDNKVSGHKTADIIVSGPKTVVEDNGDAKVVPAASDAKQGP
jgi:hypothetical protein